jgi:large subunit ribosomal protein L19
MSAIRKGICSHNPLAPQVRSSYNGYLLRRKVCFEKREWAMDAQHLVSVEVNESVESFQPGDTVRVNFQVREGSRVRIQAFEGTVIRRRGRLTGTTFTVRRVSHNIGVERTFPLFSPLLESVNVLRRGKVRRARLYYLRGRYGRAARVKERGRGIRG